MNPPPVHRLPALIEAAAHRLKLTARAAVERTVESLSLAALAACRTGRHLDGLLLLEGLLDAADGGAPFPLFLVFLLLWRMLLLWHCPKPLMKTPQ